jgi:hypothetical protein
VISSTLQPQKEKGVYIHGSFAALQNRPPELPGDEIAVQIFPVSDSRLTVSNVPYNEKTAYQASSSVFRNHSVNFVEDVVQCLLGVNNACL